jgi:hypothetical protein
MRNPQPTCRHRNAPVAAPSVTRDPKDLLWVFGRGLSREKMRKANPHHRWHLSAKEKKTIRRMTKRGIRQSVIARTLGITAPSVSRAQRAMGLPTHLVWPEQRILALFKEGWGGYRISKYLHVPANQVYAVAHKNHFRRKDNVGYPTNSVKEAAFVEAVKRKENYSKRLARQYGVGLCKANRLAKQILGVRRLRPGLSKPSLSSDYPQRHFRKKKIGEHG